MKVLDLFSGIGGFSLGLERAGMKTVAFCEIDPFCRKVLAKHWPDVPCHDDIRTFNPAPGTADVVCGGFPCQPFSAAGKRRGTDDDRHLWPEMARVIAEVKPSWVIGENVTGIIGLALDGVLSDLEGLGYGIWPVVLPACAVDAPHRRDRIWVVAHSALVQPGRQEQRSERQRIGECRQPITLAISAGDGREPWRSSDATQEPRGRQSDRGTICADDLADADDTVGIERYSGQREALERGSRWLPEPDVGRVAHGVPHRVDRLRSLGNAVVPQVVEVIGRAIMEAARPAPEDGNG